MPAPGHATRSDLLALLDAQWEPRTAQTVRQIRRIVNPPRQGRKDEEALLISVLAAFPDRVARRRPGGDLQFSNGSAAQLAPSSTVTDAPFLVAVEAEDRPDQKSPLVRIASAVEPEWLLDLFPDRVRETSRVEWNRVAERVESVSALLFDQMPIEESRGTPDPATAAELLAARAVEAGVARFADAEELDAWLGRVEFARQYADLGDAVSVESALASLAFGLKSFTELEAAAGHGGLRNALQAGLSPRVAPACRGTRARADPPAARPPGAGALRAGPAAVDRIAAPGFFRHAKYSGSSWGRGAGGGEAARSQPSACTTYKRSCRILGAALSPGPQGACAQVSQTPLPEDPTK